MTDPVHDDPWKVPAVTPQADAGSTLIYQSATGLEKAMADVDGGRLLEIYAEAIIDVWNPWQISAENLPYLAWAMGVPLWEDGWSDETKRGWTAAQFQFKALRGTVNGIRMALDFAGRGYGEPNYELQEVVAPPQGFYASPSLTPEEWDTWVHLMPEVRIKFARGIGSATGDEFFAEPEEGIGNVEEGEEGVGGDGFADVMGAAVDDGIVLWGRKAIIRRGGVDTPIDMWDFRQETEQRQAVDYERISIPGISSMGFVADESYAEEDKFVCAEEQAPLLYTLRIDQSYDHITSGFHLDTLVPGLEPLDVRHEIESDIGSDLFAKHYWFDAEFSDDAYVDGGTDAAEMLADRVFLFDPAVAAIQTAGVSFADVDRVGFPAFTMELMIDLNTRDREWSFIADESYESDGVFASPQDLSHIDRAARAVVAAKAFRDRAWLAFDPTREIELRDFADENTVLNDQIRQLL